MDTESLSWGVERPGRGVNHPPPSNAEVKKRVELYLHSSSGLSWHVLKWALPFTELGQVRSRYNTATPTNRIFMKFDTFRFLFAKTFWNNLIFVKIGQQYQALNKKTYVPLLSLNIIGVITNTVFSVTYAPSWGFKKQFLGEFAELRKSTTSFGSDCPSVSLSAWNNSAPTEEIFMKFDIHDFSKICRDYSSFIKIWQE